MLKLRDRLIFSMESPTWKDRLYFETVLWFIIMPANALAAASHGQGWQPAAFYWC